MKVFRRWEKTPIPRHLRATEAAIKEFRDGDGRDLVELLSKEPVWQPFFQIVRLRERSGEWVLDHDERYVMAMINALGGGMDAEVLNQAIREDRELREGDFWRIFEVEGTRRISLAYLDRYRGNAGQGWRDSIVTLVVEGTLPREGLLDGCLDALDRGFHRTRAAWFRAMFTALKPTVSDLKARELRLDRLAKASDDRLAEWAQRRVKRIH